MTDFCLDGELMHLDVPEPQLWWPRKHGAQPLYELVVNLKDGEILLDSRTASIGIRKIRPVLTST